MSDDPKFIHLKVHSDFSIINGLQNVKKIVAKAKELHMPAVAVTDQMNLYGLIKFYNEANNQGIKAIVGCNLWMQNPKIPNEIFEITALAMNNQGYKNITMLISEAHLRGYIQEKPVIDRDWLIKYNEGIILLSGGISGDLGYAIKNNDLELQQNIINFYKQNFKDRFYVELNRINKGETTYLNQAVKLAYENDLPVVATNDVVFLHSTDFNAHEIRVAINDGYTLSDSKRPRLYNKEQYFRSSEEMLELFHDIPEALINTVEIAKRCNVDLRLGEYFLPDYPTDGMPINDFLIKTSKQGLEERLQYLYPEEEIRNKKRHIYDERLDLELKVINDMGFPGYFLIVMEFIQWSKDNNIPVGPGRGSGAGSLVAYALKITDLDPLEFDLLFERFLNPERVSMPDFDVDFCMDRRDEVIEHVADLYGHLSVSQITTFGTMAAKGVVRDVGRVLGYPYGQVDRLAKLIPFEPGMTLDKAWKIEPQLDELYQNDEDVKIIIDQSRILEGVTRNVGKHAGGVVIAPTELTDFSPLFCDENGENLATQFDKNDVEAAGLVKFDFLGLKTLTIIQWAIDLINEDKRRNKEDLVDISKISIRDQKCFKVLQSSQTTAIFQLESSGMKNLIKRLVPDSFEDIIALMALFRPGPLQSGMVDNFIERKHGREKISYPDKEWQHESLKDILDPTYGIILYQEQVMQIAQVLSGYSLGEADILRRAMGKKKPEEMEKQRSIFKQGAINNGIDGELAMKIFDLVEKFAGYGFNKSHSAAYALLSYQTLWLKTYYPSYFMAAVLSAEMMNIDKIVFLVEECKTMGLTILAPDINKSEYKFTVTKDGHILYGLGAIKGLGEIPTGSILKARNEKKFENFFDVFYRVDLQKVNRLRLTRLVSSGAMDVFGSMDDRAEMLSNIDVAYFAAHQKEHDSLSGQTDLFGMVEIEKPATIENNAKQVPILTDKERLAGEKEAIGIYLTGHPINSYKEELQKFNITRLDNLMPTGKKTTTTIGGIITSFYTKYTKTNKIITFVTIEDGNGKIDFSLFSDDFEKYKQYIEMDKLIIVEGNVHLNLHIDELRFRVQNIMSIGDAREKFAQQLNIKVSHEVNISKLEKFYEIISDDDNKGVLPLNIEYTGKTATCNIPLQGYTINPSENVLELLYPLFGKNNITVKYKE